LSRLLLDTQDEKDEDIEKFKKKRNKEEGGE
jgi:hypothetical protein